MAGALVPTEKGGAFSGLFPGFIFRPTDRPRAPGLPPPQKDRGACGPVSWRTHPGDRPLRPRRPPTLAPPFGRRRFELHLQDLLVLLLLEQCHHPPQQGDGVYYCFAHTSRRGSGTCRTTRWGTLLTSGGDKPVTTGSAEGEDGVTLGYRNTLAFKIPAAGYGGGGSKWFWTCWVMNEYKLHRNGDGGPEVRRTRKAASFPAAPTKKRKNECRDPLEGSAAAPELVLCKFRCTKPMNPSELNSEFGASSQQSDHEEQGIRAEKKQRRMGSNSPRHFEFRSQDSSPLGEHKVVAAPTTPDAVDAELLLLLLPLLSSSSSSRSRRWWWWSSPAQQILLRTRRRQRRPVLLRCVRTPASTTWMRCGGC